MRHAALVFMALMGCRETILNPTRTGDDGPGEGSISGFVCDPSGRNWQEGAQVYLHVYADDGTLIETLETTSDPDGFWVLQGLEPGTYTVYMQVAGEQWSEQVEVGFGENVRLPPPKCFDPNVSKIAVITGAYDDFASVLERMGFEGITLVDGTAVLGATELCEGCQTDVRSFLTDEEHMGDHDLIMFNGGHIEKGVLYDEDEPDLNCLTEPSLEGRVCRDVLENVAAFVEGGGAVYASDWSYDLVEIIWPEQMDFAREDAIRNEAQVGVPAKVTASVPDQALAAYLGKTDDPFLAINHELNVWPPIASVSDGVSVHLSGRASYQDGQAVFDMGTVPLAASFSSGQGRVVYATFPVAGNATGDMLEVLQYLMTRD